MIFRVYGLVAKQIYEDEKFIARVLYIEGRKVVELVKCN